MLLPDVPSAVALFKRKDGEGGIGNLASTDPVWSWLYNRMILVWFIVRLRATGKTESGAKVFLRECKAWKMGINRPLRLRRFRKFILIIYNL